MGISPVLDEMSFTNFWETFHGCFYTISKLIQIICMSVSILVDLFPYWIYTNIRKTLVLDEIFFLNFLFIIGFYSSNIINGKAQIVMCWGHSLGKTLAPPSLTHITINLQSQSLTFKQNKKAWQKSWVTVSHPMQIWSCFWCAHSSHLWAILKENSWNERTSLWTVHRIPQPV